MPRHASIQLSRNCQNACVFCDAADTLTGQATPPLALRSRIDEAHGGGARVLRFTGDEPTLHPHLLKAIAYGRGIGMKVIVASNGRNLSDIRRLERLRDAGLSRLDIALHATHPTIHNYLSGRESFQQTLSAVRLASEVLPLRLTTVLTRMNQDQMIPLLDLAHELKASFAVRALQPKGRGQRQWHDLECDPVRALSLLRLLHERAKALSVPFFPHDFDLIGVRRRLKPGPAAPYDAVRQEMVGSGTPDPSAFNGLTTELLPTRYGLDAAQTRVLLRVSGTPVLPHVESPSPLFHKPSSVTVVVDPTTDAFAATATLPALAEALRQTGCKTTLLTPWTHRWTEKGYVRPRLRDRFRRPVPSLNRTPSGDLSPQDIEAWRALAASAVQGDLPILAAGALSSVVTQPAVVLTCGSPSDLPVLPREGTTLVSPAPHAVKTHLMAGFSPSGLLYRPWPSLGGASGKQGGVAIGLSPLERSLCPSGTTFLTDDATSTFADPTERILAIRSAHWVWLGAEVSRDRWPVLAGEASAAGAIIVSISSPMSQLNIREGVHGLLYRHSHPLSIERALRRLSHPSHGPELRKHATARAHLHSVQAWADWIAAGVTPDRPHGRTAATEPPWYPWA